MSENRVKADLAGWESFFLFAIMLASMSTCCNTTLTETYTEEMKNDIKEIKEVVHKIDSTFAVNNE